MRLVIRTLAETDFENSSDYETYAAWLSEVIKPLVEGSEAVQGAGDGVWFNTQVVLKADPEMFDHSAFVVQVRVGPYNKRK